MKSIITRAYKSATLRAGKYRVIPFSNREKAMKFASKLHENGYKTLHMGKQHGVHLLAIGRKKAK